jgi:hypothetical protein
MERNLGCSHAANGQGSSAVRFDIANLRRQPLLQQPFSSVPLCTKCSIRLPSAGGFPNSLLLHLFLWEERNLPKAVSAFIRMERGKRGPDNRALLLFH